MSTATGFKDKHGVEVQAGDLVERVGLLRLPRRFTAFQDTDGAWRLDESGNRTSLVYPPLEWSHSFSYEVIRSQGRTEINDED